MQIRVQPGFLYRIVRFVLVRIRFDPLVERTGITGSMRGLGIKTPLSEILAQTIFVLLLLSFLLLPPQAATTNMAATSARAARSRRGDLIMQRSFPGCVPLRELLCLEVDYLAVRGLSASIPSRQRVVVPIAMGGALVALLVLMAMRARHATITLSFNAADIQAQLDRKFPIRKSLLVASVTLSDPHVLLHEGSRVLLDGTQRARL